MRHRSLLSLAPLLAAFAACASFGTSSEPPPSPPASATAPPPPPPTVPPPGVDAGGGSVGEPDGAAPLDAEPDTSRPPRDADPPDAPVTFAKKLVFVTADTYFGTFAVGAATPSLDQADALCEASARGLPGVWGAYLSSPASGALSRLPPATEWYLPTPSGLPGARVFASKAAISLGPEVPINVTAAGGPLGASEVTLVWTGTLATGAHDLLYDCGDWRTLAAMGRVGSAGSSTVSEWSSVGTADCGKTARLYCFQL